MKKLLVLLLLFASHAFAGGNLGDFDASAVVYGKFTTYRPSTGATFTLAGTPVLSVYKDNSTTQSTSGVTLTADFDSVTGLNHFAVDTSSDGTFYSAGSYFDVVITTGTVDSVSVTGTVVASFTIRKNSALKPATAGRTIVVDSAGLADANTVKIGPTGSGTAQTARDIGASVLLSSGTGTGQLSLSSGAVLLQATQTGVTIPTVTNLTNAPTSGDFTSTMKTSIGTAVAASAVASVTGNVGGNVTGSVGSVVGAVGSVTGAVASVTGNVGGNVTGSVGSIASGGISEASFATTAGSFKPLGITDQGTAQAYTSGTPSLTLRSAAAFGDNALTGMTALICGSTQGYCQAQTIASNVGSTDVATLSAALPVTASGTVTYYIFGTAPSSGGGSGGLDAAGVRAAVGLTSANLDTQLSGLDGKLDTIDNFVDTEVAAIKTKTDFLPSATAGASGGLFIAGSNAATSITTALTANLIGNVTGNLSGSVGSATVVNGLAANVITAAATATDFTTEIQTGLATSTALSAISTTIGVAGAGLTAADDAVMIRLGTPAGASVSADIAAVKSDSAAILVDTGTTLDGKLDTIDGVADAIKAKTDNLTFTVTGQVDANTESMNGNAVCGTGDSGNAWTGCP